LTSPAYSLEALRSGAWHYLSGRAVTAALTITIQLTLVRLLAVDAYGQYAALLASMELAIILGAFGLNWGAARFVPEYRLKATYGQAHRFIARLLAWRIGGLVAASGLWLAVAAWVLPAVGGADAWIVRSLLAALIVVEGLSLFVRDTLLGALLQQKTARAANILRQASWIALLGVLWSWGTTTLMAVLVTELMASAIGLAVGWRGLRRGLRSGMAKAQGAAAWSEPTSREIWTMCSRVYASDLLGMIASAQTLAILTQRIAGNDVAALYGFLRVMLNQVSRYLPATLLFSLIQPKLTASYVEGGGMPALARNANLVGKTSLVVLMPIIIVTAVAGDAVLTLLSGHRFTGTGWLLFVALLHKVPGSQGQLLMTVAVVSGHAGMSTAAMASSLVALPLALIGLLAGLGVWAPVVAQLVGTLLVISVLMALLWRKAGYSPRGSGLLKISFAAMVAAIPVAAASRLLPQDPFVPFAAATLGVFFYLVVLWRLQAVSQSERQLFNRVVGRRVFPI
jgi:O-antigen/teichoic acid export membrane protein